jgi:origin recognition complex subunit 2
VNLRRFSDFLLVLELIKASYQEDESDGDFSASASDFDPNEESSSSEDSSASENEEEPQIKKPQSVASRVLKTPSVASSVAMSTNRRSTRGKSDFQYILQSDDYFTSASTKTKTSDHTLDRLKNPRLPHDQLIKLLANMELSKEHKKSVKDLNNDFKFFFDKWLTCFDEGYTILLHGFGSKRNLLQAFHKEKLANQRVLVVNGFFPSLTIKDILDNICVDMLEMAAVAGNPHEIVSVIEEEMKEIPALNLFIIVHNIDGTMLRNDKAQSVLSRLASVRNIHMIASIDHINAPLRRFLLGFHLNS